MPTGGGMKRILGGMPFVLTMAHGPGRVAFSRDSPGELVVLPLHPGMELDVREHAFLLASHTIGYSFVRIQGLANVLHGGNGMYLDRFVTSGAPGLLAPARLRQRLRALAATRREDHGRARRLPVQGRVGAPCRRCRCRSRPGCCAAACTWPR